MIPSSAIILLYVLKVACCIAVFYAIYHVLLRRLRFAQLNRYYLLYTVLLSCFIPLLSSESKLTSALVEIEAIDRTVVPIRSEINLLEAQLVSPPTRTVVPLDARKVMAPCTLSQPGWADLVLIIYVMGVIMVLFGLIQQLVRLRKIYQSGQPGEIHGYPVRLQDELPISSFFGIVFWPKDQDERQSKSIIQHEIVHGKQWHSLDMLLIRLVTALQWFNPLLKVIQDELALQHEYIADEQVTRNTSGESYRAVLSSYRQFAPPQTNLIPASSFAAFLKKRIVNLHREETKWYHLIKYFLIIPSLVGCVLLFSKGKDLILDRIASPDVAGIDCSLHPVMKVAGLTFEMRRRGQGETLHYAMEGHFEHSAFSKNLDHPLHTLCRSTPINYEKGVKVSCIRIRDGEALPSVDRVYYQSLDLQAFLPMLDPSDLVYFKLEGRLGDLPFILDIGVFTNRASHYLTYRENRYNLSFDPSYIPINTISKLQFEALLTGQRPFGNENHVEVNAEYIQIYVGDEKQNLSPSGDILYFDLSGIAQPITYDNLLGLVNGWRELESPIVLAVSGPDGKIYYGAFAQSPQPVINLKDYESSVQNAFKMMNARIQFSQNTSHLSWGELRVIYGATAYGDYGVQSFQTMEAAWEDGIPVSLIKQILQDEPSMGQGKMNSAIVNFHYVDRVGVPFDCQSIRDGKSPECLDAVIERIKPGDFIRVRKIMDLQGKEMAPGFQIKIVADK